jgi:hypothetical protein
MAVKFTCVAVFGSLANRIPSPCDSIATPVLAAAVDLFPRLLPWLIGLLTLALVGVAAIFLIRRSLRDRQSGSTGQQGFSLHQLREMHAAGELTEEEFIRAKATIIERVRAPAAGKPSRGWKPPDSHAPRTPRP